MSVQQRPSAAPADLETALRRLSGSGAVLWVGSGSDPAAEWLEQHFDRVENAAAGDALERTARERFALAVVGAGSQTLDLVRELRQAHPRLPLVAVTARDPDLLVELIGLGIRSVALLPLDGAQLLEKVHHELVLARDLERQHKHVGRLEREVRLRTEELRETQLQVVRLQEAKDNMLALISHEIRTPLNGILGFIDLLRSPEFSADAASFLVHVEESAHRLERSTRKALDFASLSTGLRAVHVQHHRLQSLVEAAQEQLGVRGLGLAVLWSGAETLYTDGELMVQVFRNLFENSAKYAGPDTAVRVSLERDGRWDVLCVRDNGPGFSAAVLPTLFQPFSTGSILHHAEGMGLGLALIDVIVLTLGGRVDAGNADEGGAMVRLRFPVREE